MTLTEPQLELAARRYCALSGQDADAMFYGSVSEDGEQVTHPVLHRRAAMVPGWKLIANDIRKHLWLTQSINDASALSEKESQIQTYSESISL